MKEILRFALILGMICAIASGLLAIVNNVTKGRILAQAEIELNSSLKEVIPDADTFLPVKDGEEILYYKAFDAQKNTIGFAFKSSKKGYSSFVETLAGIDRKGQILNIKVINQVETPGLGSRVTEDSFTGQFKQQYASLLTDVQAITGATISSRAVIEGVKEKASRIQERIKNEQ